MKLEIGEKYTCKNRPDIIWVRPLRHIGDSKVECDVKFTDGDYGLGRWYLDDGVFASDNASSFNLVAQYEESSVSLKLEIGLGKKYVCRNTPHIKYVEPYAKSSVFDELFHCKVYLSDNTTSDSAWEPSGHWLVDKSEHDFDLVAEYVETKPLPKFQFEYEDEPKLFSERNKLGRFAEQEKKCECGAEKVGHKTHSTWCIKHAN